MKKPGRQTVFLGTTLLIAAGVVAFSMLTNNGADARRPKQISNIPFNGERAYSMLQKICRIGSRTSGTPGMIRQQEILTDHFESLGATVTKQPFRVRHPEYGSPVNIVNLIVTWHPDRQERVLLCSHYDTRPFPDRDPDRRLRKALFVGANDGASGVALLAELGTLMPQLDSRYGVDFVFFDAEELVYDDKRDEYFLGSKHFAEQYVRNPPRHRYRLGVLLDMVADKHLELYQERHSTNWSDTRPLVQDIWRTAERLGVREFVSRPRHTVLDDHTEIHKIAGIPCCDIIDFDYPAIGVRQSYWHTTHDTPDKCSAASLAKVGWVLHEWLKQLE